VKAGTMRHHLEPASAWPDAAIVRPGIARDGGQALPESVRRPMEAALGHDFSAVRIHVDAAARAAARSHGARAVTVGDDIAFASGRYAPHTPAGAGLLAHELAHAVQQRGHGTAGAATLQGAEREAARVAGAVAHGTPAPRVSPAFGEVAQFDLESSSRLETVHQNVFPAAPAGGAGSGGASALGGKPWVDKGGAGGGTAEAIKSQARAKVLQLKKDEPLLFAPLPKNTTDKDIDTDVVAADARLRKRFPQITKAVDPKTLQDAAAVYSAADIVPSKNPGELSFSQAWLANKLAGWTDVSKFAIEETDPRFTAMLDELFADATVGALLKELVLHQSGFIAEAPDGTRTIRINQAASAVQRSRTLVHEVTHFHAHDRYREWLKQTADPRTYGEGLTEWLALKAMTDDERAVKGSDYPARVKRVEDEIVPHVPEDDIARAYFQGEVWRLETRSKVAQTSFAEASGIKAGAKEKDEIVQSRTGRGLNQEVQPSVHYRFLNLGHDRAEPKPEHVDYFRALKTRLLDAQPAVTLKFVGHASTPGTWAYNNRLSLDRAKAFYKMARDHGVDAKRLPDAAAPEHFGERKPTLTEENAQTRAFNRRVELFLTGAAKVPGAGAGKGSDAGAGEREE
jgi:outer membrane protein OmpA-like peptidoglycan-associated protein